MFWSNFLGFVVELFLIFWITNFSWRISIYKHEIVGYLFLNYIKLTLNYAYWSFLNHALTLSSVIVLEVLGNAATSLLTN